MIRWTYVIPRPLVETGTFGEKTREVARRWRLLSKEEQDAFKTQECFLLHVFFFAVIILDT